MCVRLSIWRWWLFWGAALLLSARLAGAEEPCRRDGATVVCPEPDFRLLIHGLLECRSATKLCELREQEAIQRAQHAEAQLAACLATPPTVAPPPKPASYSARSVLAVGLAVAGTAAVSAAFLSQLPPGADVAAGLSGAAAVFSGVLLVLPWP